MSTNDTLRGRVVGYFAAKQALRDFETENPYNSGKRWEACFYALEAAEAAMGAALAEPVSGGVVLPDNLESHRGTWLDAFDRLIELEPTSSDPESCHYGQRELWQHERKAMLAMYADLDRLKAPKVCDCRQGRDACTCKPTA